MRVLVTGGAGYIGYELAKELLSFSDIEEIIIYDSFIRSNYHAVQYFNQDAKIKFVRGDILDGNKLTKALVNIDVVCHLAAVVRAPVNVEFTHLFEQVNHWGTAELCSSLESSSVKKIIYLSSGAVYGASAEPAAVSDEPNPTTSYGYSKLHGEHQLERLKNKMEVVILRLGNVFGNSPAMHYGSLINAFNLSIKLKEPLLVHGCGDQIRPYIHVNRVVKTMRYFVLQIGINANNIYNVYDFNVSINELLGIYHTSPLDFEVIYVNQNRRLNDLRLLGQDILHNLIGKPGTLKQSILEALEVPVYI